MIFPFPNSHNGREIRWLCTHSTEHPPTLTEGTITPEILHRWEQACVNYFRHKKIPPDDQVEAVLFEIQDLRLSRWIEANELSLATVPFANFMGQLCEEALGTDAADGDPPYPPGWSRLLRFLLLPPFLFRTPVRFNISFFFFYKLASQRTLIIY